MRSPISGLNSCTLVPKAQNSSLTHVLLCTTPWFLPFCRWSVLDRPRFPILPGSLCLSLVRTSRCRVEGLNSKRKQPNVQTSHTQTHTHTQVISPSNLCLLLSLSCAIFSSLPLLSSGATPCSSVVKGTPTQPVPAFLPRLLVLGERHVRKHWLERKGTLAGTPVAR